MDQARSTISKIFNGEPRSYTRFNLTQNMEGDNSQVEMKLSSEIDEEAEGNGVGDHLNHVAARDPYAVRKPGRTPKNICFAASITLLIFIIGYLIGYLVHRRKDAGPTCAATSMPFEESYNQPETYDTVVAPIMDWDDVKNLLAQRVSAPKFEEAFSYFASTSHRAGSPGDDDLGNKVWQKFKEYGMLTWKDTHFVKVQDPPASGYNRLTFRGREVGRPSGFLSYSATGTVKGAIIYAYYGQANDFNRLALDKNIDLTGRVVLVRAGRNSFAEKVANAARAKAAAVLIYPDPADYSFGENTELFGHVHLGSGDPYTPGFPSFNHTQFPPAESSGLPSIPAQTITARMARDILGQLGGLPAPTDWGAMSRLGNETDEVVLEVNNVLVEKRIINVFGVIKGFVDSDRYVILGAQRDAWGPGFAKSTVGTSILMELARSISDMVKHDDFRPRRSIVFASWSGGEYGSVGATEWLEGYLSSLNMKAFSYINLDGAVTGLNGFKASASPLLQELIASTLKEVKTLSDPSMSVFTQVANSNWETSILEPLKMDDPAYPFLATSGIPSASFHFASSSDYQYFGTMLDTRENLNTITSRQASKLAVMAAQVAGHMALRLVHDHLVRLDFQKYGNLIRSHVVSINAKVNTLQRMQPQVLPEAMTVQWLISAWGAYNRAALNMRSMIQRSDLDDVEMCRIINDRIMMVERNFLSPYISPTTSPFRHILAGTGGYTLKAVSTHLDDLKTNNPQADADLFRNQFALATWTIQGCANSLAGDIWSLDNSI